uniref:glutathione transferase n=1 Tax=Caenorhabditis japonica TaxID=281687 RepID=A0A8R1HWV1_CAEJA
MTIPQLHYFSIRGYGEYIRLLFIDNAIEFKEKNFVPFSAEWGQIKDSMIFGQMPCLKIDGQELVQTGTIMRHLARKHNLNGSNEQEATFLDMFFEGVRDVRQKYFSYINDLGETRDELVNSTIPASLEKLEALFNTHPGDYIIGDKPNYADYILFEELDVYNVLDKGILVKFPALKAFHERMWNRPNLKGYLEKRAADKIWINAVEKGMN